MPSENLVNRIEELGISPDSGSGYLCILVVEGFFDMPQSSASVVTRIAERFSERWSTSEIQPYAAKLLKGKILQAVKPKGERGNYWVTTDIDRAEALRMLAKGKKVVELEHQLFSTDLSAKLQKNFATELSELHDNFGTNGNATAFLLRKILEKLLIIVLGKLGKASEIEDKIRPGGFKGLQEIIDIASREKISGLPVLMGKTATEIKGIKFLGDSAAHNPLVNVDSTTILPQMPYIITALEELARHL